LLEGAHMKTLVYCKTTLNTTSLFLTHLMATPKSKTPPILNNLSQSLYGNTWLLAK
jgi:hypothetical protein